MEAGRRQGSFTPEDKVHAGAGILAGTTSILDFNDSGSLTRFEL